MRSSVPNSISAFFLDIVTGKATNQLEAARNLKLNETTRIYVKHDTRKIIVLTDGAPIPDGGMEIFVPTLVDDSFKRINVVAQNGTFKNDPTFVNGLAIFLTELIKGKDTTEVTTGAVAIDSIDTEVFLLEQFDVNSPTQSWKGFRAYAIINSFMDKNGKFAVLSFNGKVEINVPFERYFHAIKMDVDYIFFSGEKVMDFSPKARFIRPIGNDAAMIWDKGVQFAITTTYERFTGCINGPLMLSLDVENPGTFNFAYRTPDDSIAIDMGVKLDDVLTKDSPLFAHITAMTSYIATDTSHPEA